MKINYGIYLGENTASIAKMIDGVPVVLKSDTLKDSMPICVSINRRNTIRVGDSAYTNYRIERLRAVSNLGEPNNNTFIGFNRALGTDTLYYSSNANRSFTSTELVAEVIKTLRSFEKDEQIMAAVITVPVDFKMNQIDAIEQAAELAGIEHVEVLQEPIAAAIGYGLNSKKKNGFWLVFDFGGGTFDSALVKVEEGIMKVLDTEGNSHLGGKNLDFAIVDEILLPHIKENFSIDNILNDETSKQIYREGLKSFAEELKNELSFKETYNLYKEDRCGIDDEGEEIEIDVTVSQEQIEMILKPIFQKSIDVTKKLLERNNLKGLSLDSLILVGGPTFSPVLRKMIEEQICKPNISADPITVVTKGAAIYASTVDVSEKVREQTRDKTKIQLEISNESATVEIEEYVPIKILEDKTEGVIPDKVFVEFVRNDKAWSSGKKQINTIGEIIEIHLNEGKTNVFDVVLYDDKGNILQGEPFDFSIIQGIGVTSSMQTLPYNFGVEKIDKTTGEIVFSQIPGLEKCKSLPTSGTIIGLRTEKQIRPGVETDFIIIPLYQGEYGSDGTRAIYNEHVYDIIISGNDIPALLPEDSDVDITIKINRSQEISVQAYFPYLDYTAEIKVDKDKVQTIESKWLANELRKAKDVILKLKEDGNTDYKLQILEEKLKQLGITFENNKNDVDNKQAVLTNLRNFLKAIDEIVESVEWPKIKEGLKEGFYKLKEINNNYGNNKTTNRVNQLGIQLEEIIQTKDLKLGRILFEEIQSFMSTIFTPVHHNVVENLLFHLTEEGILSSSQFKKHFEQISALKVKPDETTLQSIYKHLKEYENER